MQKQHLQESNNKDISFYFHLFVSRQTEINRGGTTGLVKGFSGCNHHDVVATAQVLMKVRQSCGRPIL